MGTESTETKKCNRPLSGNAAVRANARNFDEFYRAHRERLYRLAWRRTRNRTEADDLVQETLERALWAFNRFRPDSDGMAWLATIMNRLFIDKYRQARRIRPLSPAIESRLVAAPEFEPEAWWLSLDQEDVVEAVAELPGSWREIFESAVLHGHSYKEIAAQTGRTVSNVGSRLHRTRRKLRALLMPSRPTGAPEQQSSAEDGSELCEVSDLSRSPVEGMGAKQHRRPGGAS